MNAVWQAQGFSLSKTSRLERGHVERSKFSARSSLKSRIVFFGAVLKRLTLDNDTFAEDVVPIAQNFETKAQTEAPGGYCFQQIKHMIFQNLVGSQNNDSERTEF